MSRRLCVALCVGGAIIPSRSVAQSVERTGWALDRFSPVPVGDRFFLTDHPRYATLWSIAASVTTEHAFDPLRVHQVYAGDRESVASVVAGMTVSHFNLHASFIRRVGVTFSLPVSWAQSGQEVPLGTTNLGPEPGVAVGDFRAGVRVRVYGEADRTPFSVHLGANVWFASGRRDTNMGDESARAESRVVLAGRVGMVRWSWSLAFAYRKAVNALNVAIGPELRTSASGGVVLLRGRLVIGPEVSLYTPVRDLPSRGGTAFFAQGQWGAELFAGAHWNFFDGLTLGLGGGAGFERAHGTPAGRLVASLEWTPDFGTGTRAR